MQDSVLYCTCGPLSDCHWRWYYRILHNIVTCALTGSSGQKLKQKVINMSDNHKLFFLLFLRGKGGGAYLYKLESPGLLSINQSDSFGSLYMAFSGVRGAFPMLRLSAAALFRRS